MNKIKRAKNIIKTICIIIIVMCGGGMIFSSILKINKDDDDQLSDLKEEYLNGIDDERRYMSIGFDDFRDSDFSMVIPLLKKYNSTATFNRIGISATLSEEDLEQINAVLCDGNELGDHTWYHCNYIYNDPMFNGQNPNSLEGNQTPFPSNEQMREDRGDGKNAFGFDLKKPVSERLSDWNNYEQQWTAFDAEWGNLTDAQCQTIRESFSVMFGKPELIQVLDELSNTYLGTSGNSKGSWDEVTQTYTGGIFTGCKTSSNHEIWERILQVTKQLYREELQYEVLTWSWPGSIPSPFKFEKEGKYYYDEDCTKLYNYLAKMPSSLYTDEYGKQKERSWVDVLRENGYLIAHDTIYPSRKDGTEPTMMSKQLIYNASYSRNDALIYGTNMSVSYTEIASEYGGAFFDTNCSKTYAAQMYDAGGSYYNFIESIRQNTSNGMVHGEVIDSADTYSMKMFLEAALQYCAATDVGVVSKIQAYNICFNSEQKRGNLVYNPRLRNTAQEFLIDAENIPSNPDGYTGICRVEMDDDKIPTLITEGKTIYLHYGIPLGEIIYKAAVKGDGSIKIYAIKNRDTVELEESNLELLSEMEINSSSFELYETSFLLKDNPVTEYEQRWGGLGNKIMGIKIVYSDNLNVKYITLEKPNMLRCMLDNINNLRIME